MAEQFDFKGMDVAHPINRILPGRTALAVNVRAYFKGSITFRNLLTAAIQTLGAAVHSLVRLNDSTPNGPVSGYTLIGGAGNKLYNNSTQIATGLSGNPLSLVPFRPNTSVQPWVYVGDSAPDGNVTISTKSLYSGATTTFPCSGMVKVRSDGRIYKTGVKEPQLAPVVTTADSTTTGSNITLNATALPWTISQATGFSFGQSNGADGTAPVIIAVTPGATLKITVTGSATINGATHAPGDAGLTTSTYPGHFVQTPGTGVVPGPTALVLGAFIEPGGTVIVPAGTGAPNVNPNIASVGASVTLTVPANAATFQVGIDSAANTFSSNSGSFTLSWEQIISSVDTKVSIIGQITAYVWGDSPHSGPVANYIWKNPNDVGSGNPRTIGDASTTATNTSLNLDSSPQDGSVPVAWTVYDSTGATTSSINLFSPALESEGYRDFNCCFVGSFFIPAPGQYTFQFVSKDQIMFGIGGGAVVSGGTPTGTGPNGQTISVVSGLPLIYVSALNGGGGAVTGIFQMTFPAAGVFPFEIDWDYWYRTGRVLDVKISPTPNAPVGIVPPLTQGVRVNVQYRYVYRSSATGAKSNPSPESDIQSIPVTGNQVTSYWSNDPQIDLVDYYRIDLATESFTYVATGPNDNLGVLAGTNTAISDELSDTELGNQLLEYDNFEPFPSIDVPQKGVCNVSGGVITWVSGGAIGGTATGFNVRWLPGTVILIGSPTSLPYIFIARPTSTTTVTIPGVPDGTALAYEIPEPALAAQPLPYLFGPTDNINFTFGVGDSLRPGTLYWCKGSNFDSAPDTNQLDVTDPGEPLVNGAMSGGRGVLFSIKRAWVIMPNFFNALATVTGTEGSTWTLQATSIDRGLYIPRCLAVEGGGNIFFRVDDGIHVSPGGLGSQSITDGDLYPLFSHENSDGTSTQPQPITRLGITIYPPDDTQPQLQKLEIVNGYMYWDYWGTDGAPHTLVFDMAAMGWILDSYQWPATVHAANEGLSIQGTLVGCADGTIRQMANNGTETGTATVLTAAIGGAGWMHLREIEIEYISTAPITLTCIAADADNGSYGPPTITIPSSGGVMTKLKIEDGPGPNKWKLMWFSFTSTTQFRLMLQGFVTHVKPWGTEEPYVPVRPFGGSGG